MQGLQHVYCRLPVVTPQRGVLGAMVWATGLLINITSDWKLQALKQIRPEAGVHCIAQQGSILQTGDLSASEHTMPMLLVATQMLRASTDHCHQ